MVDDNKVMRLMLSEMLKKIDDIEIAGECDSAIEARSFLSKQDVDILLLDVEMPGMSGLELLKLLPDKPATILVTAKTGYAIEAFELNVIDYVVKPVALPRLMLAIEKAKELLAMKHSQLNEVNPEQIFIKDNKVIRKVMLNDILWLEAKGDYVKINTAEKQYIIHSTLKAMEDKLPACTFVRIHRGFLIPVSKIEYIEDGVAYIMGTALPVSETYKNDLLKRLQLI
ncbi:MAG: response regulator transcription factor [Ferruginibacter sp.]|nr:response regulator transcription factor [Ferruginibacter sp.]